MGGAPRTQLLTVAVEESIASRRGDSGFLAAILSAVKRTSGNSEVFAK